MAFEYNYKPAQVGQIVDASNRIIDSFSAEEIINYGIALKRGTDPQNQVLVWVGDINTPVVGVSIFTHLQYTGQYPIASEVSVMTQGRVWVDAEDGLDIVAGEKAYVNVTNGAFTNVAANNLLVGKFLTSGHAQTISFILELDIA
jgi:hypothetical protein